MGKLFIYKLIDFIIQKYRSKVLESPFKHNHLAAVFKNKKIIQTGTNHSSKLLNRKVSIPFPLMTHAEVDAIQKVNKNELKNLNILIIKISINPNSNSIRLGNSKPCNDCLNRLVKAGINKIYYSDSEGEIRSDYSCNFTNCKIPQSRRMLVKLKQQYKLDKKLKKINFYF